MVNNILTELQERNKQLLEENKALKKRFDVMKMNNLTKQEIREIVGSLNSNPDEGHIKAIKDYFEFHCKGKWFATRGTRGLVLGLGHRTTHSGFPEGVRGRYRVFGGSFPAPRHGCWMDGV